MDTKPSIRREPLIEFAKGFGIVMGVCVGLGLLGWLVLEGLDTDMEPREAFYSILILCVLACVFVGGQLALDMLFDNITLFNGKVSGMQFVGAFCAFLFAWFAGLPIVDYFDPKKEEVCEEQFSIKIGRFGISKSDCE